MTNHVAAIGKGAASVLTILDHASQSAIPADRWPTDGFTLSGIGLTIGERQIVRDVTATFRGDRIYGLIGPNGSGKTSLMRILARHHRPTSGTATYRERPLSDWSARGFARDVAYVPQQLPASQQLTVRELVGLGRYPWHGPFRRPTAEDDAAVQDALRVTAIEPFADRLVDTLSGG
jgi:iron-chelate-transporting ATPase